MVTGATGLVGSSLLVDLASTPWQVRALVRSPGRRETATQTTWVQGDLLDGHSLCEACSGVDIVLHCAARMEGDPEEVTETIVHGTANLVDAARRTGVRRFVHVSSAAVYRAGPMHMASESFPLGGGSPYAVAKQRAEEAVMAAAGGLEVVILRPPAMYGSSDPHLLPLLAGVARDHAVPLTRAGGAVVSLANVTDVAQALVRSAMIPVDAPQVFNVATDPACTVAFFLDLVARTLGADLEVFEIPDDLLMGPEPPPEWRDLTAGLRRKPVPWHLVREAHQERSLDISRARDHLGLQNAVPHRTAIPQAIKASRFIPSRDGS